MALVNIYSSLNAGLEATASSVRYSADAADDATRLGVGPFVEAQLTHYTKLAASGGIQDTISSGSIATGTTGSTVGSGYGLGWYGDLAISNRLNRYITDQISIGHEDETGLLSAETVVTFARLGANIQVAPEVAVGLDVSYEDAKQYGNFPSVFGFSSSHYQQFTLALSTGYQLTKKLNVSLGYNLAIRTSSSVSGEPSQGYTQNAVYLKLDINFEMLERCREPSRAPFFDQSAKFALRRRNIDKWPRLCFLSGLRF